MKNIMLTVLALFMAFFAFSQNKADTYVKEGNQLVHAFKEMQALQKFLEALNHDPNHLEALTQASLMYSREGFRSSGPTQIEYYKKGAEYAERALNVDPDNAEANYVMAVAKGRMAQILPTKEKIEASKDIKAYAEKALEFDKNHAGAWHLLGRWHYGVEELGATKMFLIKTIYGGLPNASYETALECFNKALRLNPDWVLFYLDLGMTYIELGEEAKAKAVFNKGLGLQPATQDCEMNKEKIRKKLAGL